MKCLFADCEEEGTVRFTLDIGEQLGDDLVAPEARIHEGLLCEPHARLASHYGPPSFAPYSIGFTPPHS